MNAFYRALKDAFRYWHLLALSIACSFGVALMWGFNIAALYPVIEITLSGKSLQEWNREQHVASVNAVAHYRNRIDELRKSGGDTPQARGEIALAEAKIVEQEAVLLSNDKLQDFLDRWMPETPMKTVLVVVAVIMVGNIFKQLLMVFNQCLVAFISTRVTSDIRTALFDKALTLDRPTYMSVGTSGFVSQITHATEMLGNGIMCFYSRAVTEPLKIVVCLAGAWYISWRLTLASLLIAPLVTVAIIWLNKRLKKVARSALNRSLGFHHVIFESLNNLLTVQAYTMEDYERERFQKSTVEMRKNSMRYTFYDSLTSPITEALGVGMICTAILMGAHLIVNQETHILGVRLTDKPIAVSSLMIFFGMLVSTNDPIRKLSSVISVINSGSVAATSLYSMLDLPPAIRDPKVPRTVPHPFKTLEFRDVTFAYHAAEPVLHGVNLKIPFGQRVAIVGPNGGGKSTLMNLVNRFYDPVQGQVLLDDVSLKEMTLKDLRGRIALVTQHIEMFNESILANIRYGRWDATDEEVIAASKQAYAHDFIQGFDQGYDTIVGPNGTRLSGGQRQRIALARAILRNAEILILDEATSQIDAASEKLIHAALENVCVGRTVLMITHRPSTLELADVIVHVQHGQVHVQTPELLARAA
ncbi:MAG: ABC transporter ATP-binding protein [Pirellulales bacterium]